MTEDHACRHSLFPKLQIVPLSVHGAQASRKCCHPLKPNPLAQQTKSSIQHFPNQLIPLSLDGRALPTEMSHKRSTGKAIVIIIMSTFMSTRRDYVGLGMCRSALVWSAFVYSPGDWGPLHKTDHQQEALDCE